jgi:nucleoside-diphosphate-sugar epimerase
VASGYAGSFEIVIARPMWVYGPGSASTARLFENIVRGRMVLIGGGRNLIQPVYIADMGLGLIRCAAAAGLRSEIVQFAGPAALTTSQMCSEIAAAHDVAAPALSIPFWAADLAAYLVEKTLGVSGRKLPIDREKVDFFRVHHSYSLTKAGDLLKWTPGISFAQGVRRTVEAFRTQKVAV